MAAEDEPNVRAMNALRRLVSALRSSGAGGSTGIPVSIAQRFALRVIGARPGLTMTELASATLTTRSTVSELVVRLVEAGLVRREADPADHRRVRVHLTADGARAVASLGETLPERLVAALDGFPPAARAALADSLESWVEAAGLGGVRPVMFGEPAVPGEDSRVSHRVRAHRVG